MSLRRIAPCCDNPPHDGPCDAVSHRYRATRAATEVEVRVAGHRGQGGLVQLVKRSMEANLDEDLEVRA